MGNQIIERSLLQGALHFETWFFVLFLIRVNGILISRQVFIILFTYQTCLGILTLLLSRNIIKSSLRYEKPLIAERGRPKNRRRPRLPVPEPANPPSWVTQAPQVPAPPPGPPPPQELVPPQPMQPPPGPPLPVPLQHPEQPQQLLEQPGGLVEGSTCKAVPPWKPIRAWHNRLQEMSAEELNSHILWHLNQHRPQPSCKAGAGPKPTSKCSAEESYCQTFAIFVF